MMSLGSVLKMNKQALLIGSSYSALPLLFELNKNNIDVSVCGKNTDDPCHKFSKKSYFIDYSKTDDIMPIFKEENFDYIIPSCNDTSYLTCIEIANQYNLPGFDTIEKSRILHNKKNLRNFLENNKFPTPALVSAQEVQSISRKNQVFLVKPVDSFSGRGISKINSESNIYNAIQHAKNHSISNRYIIEEFKEGALHSVSAFIKDGQIIDDFFVDEFCSVYEYQVDCSYLSIKLTTKQKERVRNCVQELITNLTLSDGLLHVQFISRGNEFWIIECMRRCPGDLFYHMIELSTGTNYKALYLNSFTNHTVMPVATSKPIKYISRHTITSNKKSKFMSFNCNIPDCKQFEFFPLKYSGEYLNEAPNDKAGILFSKFSTQQTLVQHAKKLASYIEINSNDK